MKCLPSEFPEKMSKNNATLLLPDPVPLGAAPSLLEPWLRLCAENSEMLANYDRLRGTNLSGRGAPVERMIDEATGKLEKEALGFFDWCREMFERLGWEAVDG